MKKTNFKKIKMTGFTLIEILVAIALMVSASTIVIAIVTSVFRSSNKTTSIELIRHNGTSAKDSITRLIKFADSFVGVSEDGEFFASACDSVVIYSHVRVKSEGIDRTISCTDSDIAIDGASLIDLNRVEVVPATCTIICSQEVESVPPIIGLSFDLTLADTNQADLPEGNVTVNFSTSVKMRN